MHSEDLVVELSEKDLNNIVSPVSERMELTFIEQARVVMRQEGSRVHTEDCIREEVNFGEKAGETEAGSMIEVRHGQV